MSQNNKYPSTGHGNWHAALPVFVIAVCVTLLAPATASAQSVSELFPPQGQHYAEGETVDFYATIEDVAVGDITSVTIHLADNSATEFATVSMSWHSTVTKGERYHGQYTIPYNYLDLYGHQNLKWYIECVYTGGTIYGPGSGQHVIHVDDAPPPSGTLNVNIDPEDIGASYTITGPTEFNGGSPYTSGTDFSDDVPIGSYTVTFTTVTGWSLNVTVSSTSFNPANPSSGTVGMNETHTVNGVYTRETGTLIIEMETAGGGPPPGGASWTLTAYPADYTGATSGSGASTTLSNVPTGTYTASFGSVTGYTVASTPPSGTRTIAVGETKTILGTYTPIPVGTLIIEMETAGGGPPPAGAAWTLTTYPTDYSGATSGSGASTTLSDIPIGTYTASFDAVTGYSLTIAPPSGSQTLADGQTKTIKATYTRDTGTLIIEMETEGGGPPPAGASWTLTSYPGDYTGATSGSGASTTLSNVPSGTYTASFGAVTNYSITTTPDPPTQDIADGETKTIKGTYHLGAASLVMEMETAGGGPPPAGSSWTLTSYPGTYTGATSGSGATTTLAVTPGTYVASFAAVANYTFTVAPPSGSRTLAAGETKNIKATYVRDTGALNVILNADTSGASYSVTGPADFTPLVGMTTNYSSAVPTGNYTVTFTKPSGWILSMTATTFSINLTQGKASGSIPDGHAETVVGSYVREKFTGALQIFIVPPKVIKEGALWRLRGYAEWHESGDIIEGLAPQDYPVEFKLIPGWILPDLTSARVYARKLTKYTGEYIRPLIIHRSDYNGDGTDDFAVFHQNSGLWSVATTVKGASPAAKAKVILERKFGKKDDIPAPGDYDGDGLADLCYYREKKGRWVIENQYTLSKFGKDRDIPVPGDYDGDGVTDPALYRPKKGKWYIYDKFGHLSMDGQPRTLRVKFGGKEWIPTPADFNGDGLTDLAAHNVLSGSWMIAFFEKTETQWKWVETKKKKYKLNYGDIGDIPVQADYDGNGKADHAIFKRWGLWKVRKQYELEFGQRGDAPIPNDWAGLGRVIPAIFREQNGRWLATDNLLKTKHGKGGQALMSGR